MADPPPPLPVVYVEANWVVACVVPHDDHHKAATRLLDQARQGACELRLPRVGALESRNAAGKAWARPLKALEDARNAMAKAYRNGAVALNRVDNAIASALKEKQVAAY